MNCEKELPPKVVEGIWLFNSGRFFEAHEALETAWRIEPDTNRYLYQGILQLGVGYYHLQRGNAAGAIQLFNRAKKTLEPFPSSCQGIDVNQIRKQIEEAAFLVERFKTNTSTHYHFPIYQIEIGQAKYVQQE